VAKPIITTSGNLADVKQLMLIVPTTFQSNELKADLVLALNKLEETYFSCLKLADETPDCQLITLPSIGTQFFGLNYWPQAHAAARAIK